jgi:hypothetical protein
VAEAEVAQAFEAEAARIRAGAEAKLREETERARQEANARLEMEVAAIKAEAEQRRVAELEEVRAQMLRLRTASAEQARAAAEQAVAKEVARARAMTPPAQTQLAVREWSDGGFIADRRGIPDVRIHQSTPKVWLIAAGVALVAVVGGALAFGVIPIGKSKAADAPAVIADAVPLIADDGNTGEVVTGSGELQVESVPDGARIMLDGREVGFTPLTLKKISAGRHALILQGESGTVRRTVRVQAGERTVARYEITAGFLSVFSRIPLEIFDGNRKLGSSDEGHVLLAPGQYKVRLVNTHYGYQEDAEFTIRAGEISTHTVSLPEGSLLVSTQAGAEIYIEGELKGTSPLGPIPVPLGSREVLIRHPELGERRQSVEIIAGKTVELSAVLSGNAAPKTPPRLAPLSMPPERRTILPQ